MDTCVNTEVVPRDPQDVADVKKNLFFQFSGMSDSPVVEKEHLKVYLRIRPFTSLETANGESQDCVASEPPDSVVLKAPKMSLSARLSDKSVSQITQRFQFSQIYGPETTQKEMFDGTVKPLVKDVLEGGNSLVFTYGVTNAGKTFTFLGTESNEGILPRSLSVIFNSIEGRINTHMSMKPQRCREFIRLSADEQNEEAALKRSLLKLLKESDQKNTSNQSDSKMTSEGSTLSETEGSLMENSFSLELEENTKFSVWVSFCEIYNENIHDLLEPLPNGATRRPVLRLSQDVKGNLFVKDLRWVQVNCADEAFKVMRLGKKNQSFSSTKLNQLSSRSHSIFSIRVMRIDGLSRVKVSELSLCDLAGSERCAKTQNVGDRLKEAGNINTSLLTLGKCISILRYNQQAKVPQLVPFRESKLTHYLQSYFMGRGKACMIVNINQCASMYDETLSVLKFSAVAQKVVVLTTRIIQDVDAVKKGRKVSMIINNADRNYEERKLRRSSLVQWDTSLEDVQEDEDDMEEEEEDEDEEESTVEDTMQDGEDDSLTDLDREAYEEQLEELRKELQKIKSERLLMECRIREEVTKDFSELYTQMEADFSERLEREKAIIEERSEKRLELLKELVKKNSRHDDDYDEGPLSHDEQSLSLDEMVDSMCSDMGSIRRSVEEVQSCLVTHAPVAPMAMLADLQRKVTELTEELVQSQRLLSDQTSELDKCHKHLEELEETKKKLQVRCEELVATVDKQSETITKEREQVDIVRKEVLTLKAKCTCSGVGGRGFSGDTRKRRQQGQGLDGQPPLKKGAVEGCDSAEFTDPAEVEGQLKVMEAESLLKDTQLAELEQRCQSLEHRIQELNLQLTGHEHTTHTQEAELGEKSALIEKLLQQVQQLQDKVDESSAASVSQQEESERCSQKAQALELELNKLREQLKQQEVMSEQLMQQEVMSQQLRQERSESYSQKAQALELEISQLREQLKQQEVMSEQLRQKARLQSEQLLHKHSTDTQAHQGIMVTDTSNLEEKVKERQEMEDKQAVLCQREKELSEREARLQLLQGQHHMLCADKEAELEERQGEKEKEEVLRLKEASLSQKEQDLEKKLANMTSHLSEKEEKLAMKDADLSQREEALDRKLAQKEEELSQKEEELAKKLVDGQAELAYREAELQKNMALREAELLQKEEELRSNLSAKEAELSRKGEELEKALVHQGAITTQSEAELSKKEELEKKLADREAELVSREAALSQKEEELSRLQRSLKEAQERVEEAETAAVQEARRREVERRRELLAVAEEAIAQKDTELQRREQEINRLKEEMTAGADKVQSLTVDLQRREDDSSDLKEKLVDSKKQIQQVQKEISSMRDMEKTLKQKVQDLEKTRTQLQKDLSSRDRTIHQLKSSADSQSDETLQLYQKACKDLQARAQAIEDMRLVLTEQEETQTQMDLELEAQLELNQQLTQEVEKLKGLLLRQESRRRGSSPAGGEGEGDPQARQELSQAQEELKSSNEKYQVDRKRWLDEKMVLIRQAKEAEERRNQEMRRFADERERHGRQQTEMEGLSERLAEREQEMERWRRERDTLVSALEVQLQKLIASNRDKDQQLQRLQCSNASQPLEGEARVEQLQKLLSDREAEILRLKDMLKTSTPPGPSAPAQRPLRESSTQTTIPVEEPEKLLDIYAGKPLDSSTLKHTEKTRGSVISQGSSGGYPSVLESSEISTETGRRSRFPRPELEISFSPLQPDRLALKRQGDEEAVTVKITRSGRKRKSNDMEKALCLRKAKAKPQTHTQTSQDAVDSENKKNTRSRTTPKLAMHQEERSPALASIGSHGSQSSPQSGRERKLQKIGDFLQSSPTFLGSKAKKIMGLVSGRSDVDRGSSSKRSKKKLYHPQISAPMDISAHQIIGREPEEKDSDHLIMKRRLRNRIGK